MDNCDLWTIPKTPPLARDDNPTRIKMDITHTDTNTREETTAILGILLARFLLRN